MNHIFNQKNKELRLAFELLKSQKENLSSDDYLIKLTLLMGKSDMLMELAKAYNNEL